MDYESIAQRVAWNMEYSTPCSEQSIEDHIEKTCPNRNCVNERPYRCPTSVLLVRKITNAILALGFYGGPIKCPNHALTDHSYLNKMNISLQVFIEVFAELSWPEEGYQTYHHA